MRIQLKRSLPLSANEHEISHHGFLLSEIGAEQIEPLAITTTQIGGLAFLNCLDEFGASLQYSPVSIFDVVDASVHQQWVFVHYQENLWGRELKGQPCFIGLRGLEDELFVEKVMDRESTGDLDRFQKIVANVYFPTSG